MRKRYTLAGLPWSLMALAAFTIAVELLLVATDAGMLGTPGWRVWAYNHFAFWAPLLEGGQPLFSVQPATMFVSYAFLHGGPLHLAVNMIALISFGLKIVERVGQRRFLVAYLVTAIGGAACFGLLSDAAVPMVGASGALFGLLGIWVCWDYLDRRHYGDPLWVTLRALGFLVVYNLVFFILLAGNLAWETHLGGFIAGWLLAVHWGRNILAQSRRRRGVPFQNANGGS